MIDIMTLILIIVAVLLLLFVIFSENIAKYFIRKKKYPTEGTLKTLIKNISKKDTKKENYNLKKKTEIKHEFKVNE